MLAIAAFLVTVVAPLDEPTLRRAIATQLACDACDDAPLFANVDDYLARFPSSPYVGDVELARAQRLLRAQRTSDAHASFVRASERDFPGRWRARVCAAHAADPACAPSAGRLALPEASFAEASGAIGPAPLPGTSDVVVAVTAADATACVVRRMSAAREVWALTVRSGDEHGKVFCTGVIDGRVFVRPQGDVLAPDRTTTRLVAGDTRTVVANLAPTAIDFDGDGVVRAVRPVAPLADAVRDANAPAARIASWRGCDTPVRAARAVAWMTPRALGDWCTTGGGVTMCQGEGEWPRGLDVVFEGRVTRTITAAFPPARALAADGDGFVLLLVGAELGLLDPRPGEPAVPADHVVRLRFTRDGTLLRADAIGTPTLAVTRGRSAPIVTGAARTTGGFFAVFDEGRAGIDASRTVFIADDAAAAVDVRRDRDVLVRGVADANGKPALLVARDGLAYVLVGP